jgi:hypothetical protein
VGYILIATERFDIVFNKPSIGRLLLFIRIMSGSGSNCAATEPKVPGDKDEDEQDPLTGEYTRQTSLRPKKIPKLTPTTTSQAIIDEDGFSKQT